MPMPPSIHDISDTTTITHHIIDNKPTGIASPLPIITSALNMTMNNNNNNNNNNSLYKPMINKIEPSIRSIYSPLDRSIYRMSAVDMIRQQYHPQEIMLQHTTTLDDEYSTSSSSFESSNSSVSDAPITSSSSSPSKSTKKRSYRRLLREIRRLRSENDQLHSSVNILKEDLRNEKESRLIADQCHKKFFDDALDKHTQLELEIMDQKDIILSLQSRLNDTLFSSSPSSPSDNINANNSSNSNQNGLSYHDAKSMKQESIDCSLWSFEDIDCTFEQHRQQYYQNKENNEIDHDHPQQQQQQEKNETSLFIDVDDETIEDDEEEEEQQFEELAKSYLRQALISNLTSARTNLELDDLILKYDPSPERILRTLADTFLGWIRDTIHTTTATTTTSFLQTSLSSSSCSSSSSLPPSLPCVSSTSFNNNILIENDKSSTLSILVNKLLATQIQATFLKFWKNVFEQHVHNDLDQYQFLQEVERKLILHYDDQDQVAHQEFQSIVQNFQTLLIMLYKHDILEGEAITIWWHNNNNNNLHEYDHHHIVGNQLRNTTRKFVEWVGENDDEDDDDDVDDDEDYQDDDDHDDDDEVDEDDLIHNENDIIHYNDYNSIIPTINITPPQHQQVSEKKKKSVTIQV